VLEKFKFASPETIKESQRESLSRPALTLRLALTADAGIKGDISLFTSWMPKQGCLFAV
jgi:hypothetical protein